MSFGSSLVVIISFTGSPDPRQPASAAGHPARYPASYPKPLLGGSRRWFGFLSPFGHRRSLLGSSCSRRGVGPSSRSAYHPPAVGGPRRVGSDQSAVPAFRPARFPDPPSEPGMPITEHRALHKSRGVVVVPSYCARPRFRDLCSPIAVAQDMHRLRVEQHGFSVSWPPVRLRRPQRRSPSTSARSQSASWRTVSTFHTYELRPGWVPSLLRGPAVLS